MKAKEIREMAVKDLRDRIQAEKANLASLKLNHTVSPLEDTSKIKKARKDIARMMTILAQQENNVEKK